MSATARVAAIPQQRQPEVEVAPAAPRVNLRVLATTRSSAPRKPYVILLAAVLTMGLIGSLLLNTITSQNSFVIHDLRKQTDALSQEEQALIQKVGVQESPVALEQKARALGMVPSTSPVFLRLSDGKILGTPTPAKAGPKPVVARAASSAPAVKAATPVKASTPAKAATPVKAATPAKAATPGTGR